MKVLFDTNVLISAALNPAGVPCQAIITANSGDYEGYVCQYSISELDEKIKVKFPQKANAWNAFFNELYKILAVLPTTTRRITLENKIRDINDRPILRAAVAGKIDIIVTGDKDFLEAGIDYPMVMTPTEFLDYANSPDDGPLVCDPDRKYGRSK